MAPTARIEVFRPGTFKAMQGMSLTYSAADLLAAADAYDFATAPAPIVVGHPQTDAPAFGWVESFDYDAQTERLYANVGELEPAFSEAVKAGRYKKVSLSFFHPENGHNPVPGTWYPKHVGFLGGAAPAVPGLKNVAFAATTDETPTIVAFGERGFEQSASMFQRVREFFIEQFGMEAADKVLPSFEIEWLQQIEIEERHHAPGPAFSAGDRGPELILHAPATTPKETPLPKDDPAFAAREADYERRMAALTAKETAAREADNVAFAEGLVTEGKLLPASRDKVVALLNVLPAGDEDKTVSFSTDADLTPADALRQILDEQPKIVSFGEMDFPEEGRQGVASFATDGRPVDPAQMEIHQKALDYQRQHPGTSYIAAAQAVS